MPERDKNNFTNIQSPKRMNTNQNDCRVYKAENIDWDGLKAAGISKEQLEASGNMDLLLQGEESEVIQLKFRTPVINLTMDATLRLVPDANGKPVMEINGIHPEKAISE